MNIFKNTVRLLLPAIAVLLAACKPMDSKFSQFIDDGPINYIAKLDIDQVQVIGEYYRVRFIWPVQTDLRGTKVVITWASGTQRVERDLDPSQVTEFVIDKQFELDEDGEEVEVRLPESTYIFEITLFDDEGNSSLPISVTGTVYGDMWAAYQTLRPRNLVSNEMKEDGSREITFMPNFPTQGNPVLDDTFIEWQKKDDTEPRTYALPASETVATIPDFGAMSLRYRSAYTPEEGSVIDPPFTSDWVYYLGNVTEPVVADAFQLEDFVVDGATKRFVFPAVDDANWAGYEFQWTNPGGTTPTTQRTTTNEITLENCNSTTLTVRTLFNAGGETVTSQTAVDYTLSVVPTLDLATVQAAFDAEGWQTSKGTVAKFTFPATSDNPSWSGYNFRWTNTGASTESTQKTPNNEITLTGFSATKVYVSFLAAFGSNEIASAEVEYTLPAIIPDIDVVYDRTAWTVTTTTHSGYLYAVDGSTGLPEHMFDDSGTTYLSLVKPGATSSVNGMMLGGTTASQQPAIGLTPPSFTVEMEEAKTVNRFFWRHRENNSYGYLRIYGVRLEGSTDGTNFETILPRDPLPNDVTVTENIIASEEDTTPRKDQIFWIPSSVAYNANANTSRVDTNTYEIFMKEAKSYKFIRVHLTVHSRNYGANTRYERSDAALPSLITNGNTMQVSEFGLGHYVL